MPADKYLPSALRRVVSVCICVRARARVLSIVCRGCAKSALPAKKTSSRHEDCWKGGVENRESLLRDVVIVFVANCLKAWQTREELRGGNDGDNPRVNIELWIY